MYLLLTIQLTVKDPVDVIPGRVLVHRAHEPEGESYAIVEEETTVSRGRVGQLKGKRIVLSWCASLLRNVMLMRARTTPRKYQACLPSTITWYRIDDTGVVK